MAPTDRRQCLLSLTAKGRMAFAPLDQRSQNEIAAMIGKLSVADQDRIVGAMRTIESSGATCHGWHWSVSRFQNPWFERKRLNASIMPTSSSASRDDRWPLATAAKTDL